MQSSASQQWSNGNVRALAIIGSVLSSMLVFAFGFGSSVLENPWAAAVLLPVMIGATGGIVPGLITSLAYFYVIWFVGARLWLMTSRGMRVAVGSLVALTVLGAWSLKAYERRIDWTSRGLNPDRPGFKPEVVVLAGTFEYWIDDRALHNQIKNGSGMFEIRMNGLDYYYAKRWRGHKWRVGSWVHRQLAIPGYSRQTSTSKLGHTTRGSGGGINAEPDAILVGRRLWTANAFLGATQALYTNQYGQAEMFESIAQHGRYKIPTVIRFTEPERRETYRIRKVEFQNRPGKEWFEQIKRQRFERDPSVRNIPIEEPGPF